MSETNPIHIRGLNDKDDKAFSPLWIEKLKAAQAELQFLLDRDYPVKSAATFVCNHHQLSVRQQLALTRTTSSHKHLQLRKQKQLSPQDIAGQTVYIDGFNLIITLEVALSDGLLFAGQDECIRDLADLRGSYRIIPQTDKAIKLISDTLTQLKAERVVFLLDQPVSNSGRLKTKIYETAWSIPVDVDIVRNPDAELKKLSCVVSGDSIILDECISWFNMTAYILEKNERFSSLSRFIKLDGNKKL